MKKITIILPIHKLDDIYENMLINSVNSIQDFHNDVKLLIVCSSDIKKDIQKIDLGQKLEIT